MHSCPCRVAAQERRKCQYARRPHRAGSGPVSETGEECEGQRDDQARAPAGATHARNEDREAGEDRDIGPVRPAGKAHGDRGCEARDNHEHHIDGERPGLQAHGTHRQDHSAMSANNNVSRIVACSDMVWRCLCLVRVLRLGEQRTLRRLRTCEASPAPPQHVCSDDCDRCTEQRAGKVHPVGSEVVRDEIRRK